MFVTFGSLFETTYGMSLVCHPFDWYITPSLRPLGREWPISIISHLASASLPAQSSLEHVWIVSIKPFPIGMEVSVDQSSAFPCWLSLRECLNYIPWLQKKVLIDA